MGLRDVFPRAIANPILDLSFVCQRFLLLSSGYTRENAKMVERTLMHEFGLIIMGTELVVTVLICWFEIWAFDEALSVEQRTNLILLYSPWLIIPAIMMFDCMKSIKAKVESAKQVKVQ